MLTSEEHKTQLIRIICQVSPNMECVVEYRFTHYVRWMPILKSRRQTHSDPLKEALLALVSPLDRPERSVDRDGQMIVAIVALPNLQQKAPIMFGFKGGESLVLAQCGTLVVDQLAFRNEAVGTIAEAHAQRILDSGHAPQIQKGATGGFLTDDPVWRFRWSTPDTEFLEYIVKDFGLRTWKITYAVPPSATTALNAVMTQNEMHTNKDLIANPIVSTTTIPLRSLKYP
ncbi:MAG: hypothetical protein ACOY3Y_09545 [Acidobacteriota bacterium]